MPIQVSDNIIYLGEIPTVNDFEPRYSIGKSDYESLLVDKI